MMSPSRTTPGGNAEGTALVIVLGALLVLSAMALGLVLLSMTETLAAGNARRASAALYAADAGVERALPDLARAPDWDAVLAGQARSGLTDGEAGGFRELADGRRINLDEVLNAANCGNPSGCTDSAMDAVTPERPWGRNNPRWRLFGHAPLSALIGASGAPPPREYLVILVADDPAERDDDPYRDGRAGTSPGAGVIQLRAEAFGPMFAHRVVEVAVTRATPGSPEAGYAAQRGEGASAGPTTGAAVEVPGGSITRSELSPGGGMTRR